MSRIIIGWLLLAMHKRGLCAPFHRDGDPLLCPVVRDAATILKGMLHAEE